MNAWKIMGVALLLAGCNAQHGKQAPLRWAVVKKYDVTSAALERQHAEHSYPAGLANVNEDRQNRERLRLQLGELRQAAVKRCMVALPPASARDNADTNRLQGLPPEFAAAARCRTATDGDQLVADLQAKLTVLDGLDQQRRQFDQDLGKSAEHAAAEAIAKYARAQGYQLILSSDSNVLLYNEGQAVLDVTAAVVGEVRGGSGN